MSLFSKLFGGYGLENVRNSGEVTGGIDASELEGNSYFIGFSIFTEEEQFIGEVVDIDDTTENVLFLLHDKNKNELIIPASDDFVVDIDEQRKKIIMSLPEGLLLL